VELARKNPGEVWAAAGFHPNHFASAWYHDKKEQQESDREVFNALDLRKIAENKEVVAIGEFGLDYFRLTDPEKEKEDQQEAFAVQVQIAKDLNKAMMLHCRPSKGTDDAYLDATKILTTYDNLPPQIFHFYVGSPAATEKLLENGAYFTFGGVVTFSRDYDEIIKMIPLDRILLETDAPYVAPEPYRGKRNEPAYIIETYKKLAEIKKVSLEEVAEKISETASKIFRI
jgi:TatD DNase family protein